MNPVVLPQLRFRRTWFCLGLVIALGIAVVCLMPGSSLPRTGISDKSEHLLAFGALAFWFGSIVVRRDLGWLALALVAFGGVIELLQGAMRLGRDAEFRDVMADAAGVGLGLALALSPLGRWAQWMEQRILRTRP